MLHSLLLPYLGNLALQATHAQVHGCCHQWVYVVQSRSNVITLETTMEPRALDLYHSLVVKEMAERGQLAHLCFPSEDAFFKRLIVQDIKSDPASDVLPESPFDLINGAITLYRYRLFFGGRLPAKPHDIIDLLEWGIPEQRTAALRLLEEEWAGCGSPY